jgi:hypothetical protein
MTQSVLVLQETPLPELDSLTNRGVHELLPGESFKHEQHDPHPKMNIHSFMTPSP